MFAQRMKNCVMPGAAAASVTAMLMTVPAHAVVLPTVGVYDSPAQANAVDQIATPDTDQNLTSTAFTPLVATAFAQNRGGVIDFESVTATSVLIPAVSTGRNFSATYGVSQANTLTFTDTSTFTGAIQVETGSSTGISGSNYLATSGGFVFNLAFSESLLAFGITVLDREATTGSRNLNLTFTLQNNSTVVISDAVGAGGAAGQANDDTFFGYLATVDNPIKAVSFGANNFQRYDDLGFVLVPEPASLALVGLGGLLMVGRRRRQA